MLLATLTPDFLELPAHISDLIPPRPPGFALGRETFARRTGVVFDPLGPAESSTSLTLNVLLNRHRLERMNRAVLADPDMPAATAIIGQLVDRSWKMEREDGQQGALQRIVAGQVLDRLYPLVTDNSASDDLRAQVLAEIRSLQRWLDRVSGSSRLDEDWSRFFELSRFDIQRFLASPDDFRIPPPVQPPPGSPIGGS